jgi:hypothetical protein
MEFKPNLRDTAHRMARFWNLEEPEDRVPVMIALPNPGINLDGRWFGRLDAYRVMMEEHFAWRANVRDEYIPRVNPQYGHAMIAAVCGSPICAKAETVWALPVIDDARRAGELRLDWANPWSRQILEDYDTLLRKARGRYAVGEDEIEGVSDTAAALRGAEGLFMDIHNNPGAAGALLSRVAGILIEYRRWNHENVGARQDLCGGMTTAYSMWMPEGSAATCEDASVMMSGPYFREHIFAHTARFTASCVRTIMEVHAEGFHQIKEFGDMPGVSLLTVGNPLNMEARYQADVRKLLGKKCFRFGVRRLDDIDTVLDFAGIKGVFLVIHVENLADAAKALVRAEKATQRVKKDRLKG